MTAQTPSNLLFATRVEGLKRDMEAFTDAGAIFRSHPEAARRLSHRRRRATPPSPERRLGTTQPQIQEADTRVVTLTYCWSIS